MRSRGLFEIDGELRNFYQCHCWLCRKATGAAANAATFVAESAFRWLSGQREIRSFQKPSGYRSDFCSGCGSPVPNRLRNTKWVWVPAGLLSEPMASKVSVYLHTDSAASWAQDTDDCVRLGGGPESLDALNDLL